MGKEATAEVRIGRETAECAVHLECNELVIRGGFKRKLLLTDLRDVQSNGGSLQFLSANEAISIDLGDQAATWLERIRNPRTRIDKLGLKPGMSVVILGPAEEGVADEVRGAIGSAAKSRLGSSNDLVLLFVESPSELERLAAIEPKIAEKGAVWVLYPKGRRDLRHEEVVVAARSARLVQTKSMGFSDRLSGLRLTRPAKK